MKLEVGKYYKSRDGRKLKCIHEFEQSDQPFVIISDHDGITSVGRYTVNGEICGYGNCVVSEWVEPVEHGLRVYAYQDGDTIMLRTKRIEELKPIAVVPFTFTEGEGL